MKKERLKRFSFVLILSVFISLLMIVSVSAEPLKADHNGTVSGDLYVQSDVPFGNEITGKLETGEDYKEYQLNATLPEYENIQWAKLYVNVYSGSGLNDWPSNTTVKVDGDGDGDFELVKNSILNYSNPTADGQFYVIEGTEFDDCNRVFSDYQFTLDLTDTIKSENPKISVRNVQVENKGFDSRIKYIGLLVAYNKGKEKITSYWVNSGQDYIKGSSNFSNHSFDLKNFNEKISNASLYNIALSSTDGLYNFNNEALYGDPIYSGSYSKIHSWNVLDKVKKNSLNTLEYKCAPSGSGSYTVSFKNILSILTVNHEVLPSECSAEDIKLNTKISNVKETLLVNLANVFTFDINGTPLRAYDVDVIIKKGSNVEKTQNFKGVFNESGNASFYLNYTLTDSQDRTVFLKDLLNNVDIINKTYTPYYSGYAGQKWSNGKDLANAYTYKGKYNLDISFGDSKYNGATVLNKNNITTIWNANDFNIPEGSTLVDAILYQGFTWDKSLLNSNLSFFFNDVEIKDKNLYSDTKGYGSYNYPSGLFSLNVKDQFKLGKTNKFVLNTTDSVTPAFWGAYLVLIYENANENLKEITISEGTDILGNTPNYATNDSNTISYANINSIKSNIKDASAITVVASANVQGASKYVFNGKDYGGLWNDYNTTNQVSLSKFDLDPRNVKNQNIAEIRSVYNSSKPTETMTVFNHILILGYPYMSKTTILNSNDSFFKQGEENYYVTNLKDELGNNIVGHTVGLTIFSEKWNNNKTYYRTTDDDGLAKLEINLNPGKYDMVSSYDGDEFFEKADSITNIFKVYTDEKLPVLITKDLLKSDKEVKSFDVSLLDYMDNPIADKKVVLNLITKNSNKEYNFTTDSNGTVKLPINLAVGDYKINSTFKGGDEFKAVSALNNVVVYDPKAVKLVTNDLFKTQGDSKAFEAILTDYIGKPIAGKKIVIDVIAPKWNKEYNYTTDPNGMVKLPVNLNKGLYTFKTMFKGDDSYKPITKLNKVIVGEKGKTNLLANNLTKTEAEVKSFSAVLMDGNAKPIANKIVALEVIAKNWKKTYNLKTNSAGTVNLPINLAVGDYKINSTFKGGDEFKAVSALNNVVVYDPKAVKLVTNDLFKTQGDSKAFEAILTDYIGKPLAGKKIVIDVIAPKWNKEYNFITNSNGMVKLPVNLNKGLYTFKTMFKGDDSYKPITKLNKVIVGEKGKTNLLANDLTKTKAEVKSFSAVLMDGNAKPIANKIVALEVIAKNWKKTYNLKTNSAGTVNLPINLAVGNYKIKSSYGAIAIVNNVKVL